MLDSILQEVDVRTGLVVWEWHGLGHIPLSDSYATPATSVDFDAYHLNSIQLLAHDQLLVSARDTSAVYEIDRRSGQIVDTRRQVEQLPARQGRALLLPARRADAARRSREPVRRRSRAADLGAVLPRGDARARRPAPHRPASRGSTGAPARTRSPRARAACQTLPNGNEFVGFGSSPFFSEFSAAGSIRFEASLPRTTAATASTGTRGTRRRRRGRPRQRSGRRRHVSVYASWNGATTVARWQVLAGRAQAASPLSTAPADGFETRISVRSTATPFAVRALSASGQVLATSLPVSAS